MDTTRVGILAAQLMESIERKHRHENGEEAPVVIGEVMLIVEVKADPDAPAEAFVEEYEDFASVLESECTDGRIWVQVGMLHSTQKSKELLWEVSVDDDDGEEDES